MLATLRYPGVLQMPISQFMNSLARIASNPNIHRGQAVARHFAWQLRKATGRFPCELPLSKSILIAASGKCGVSALVNAHGMYDFNNMTLILSLLERGGVFVDVGSNIGSFALIASEQSAAQVLAFEPHPATFGLLQANIARNHRTNVIAVAAAVGNSTGQVTITDTPGSSATHIVSADESGSVSVPLVRLDLELAARDLHPYIVKIDVEGFELDVLRGLGGAIDDVAVVLVEINGLGQERAAGAEVIQSFLVDAGFHGPVYYDASLRTLGPVSVLAGEDPIFVARREIANFAANFGITTILANG